MDLVESCSSEGKNFTQIKPTNNKQQMESLIPILR